MLQTLPAIVPGGKVDPSIGSVPGVTPQLEGHFRKLREEEDKIRDELRARDDKLRRMLYAWDKLELEAKVWETRADLSEKSMKNLADEGLGGAAF